MFCHTVHSHQAFQDAQVAPASKTQTEQVYIICELKAALKIGPFFFVGCLASKLLIFYIITFLKSVGFNIHAMLSDA